MATKRKYAYYIKGNKIAIIEEGQGSGVCSLSGYNTQSACEDAGGTWTENASGVNDGEYRSPIQTITGGLEIQYAYSPTFNLLSSGFGNIGTDFHRFLGWGSNGHNLLLFTFSGASTVVDLSSLFNADDWIYISGSGRWSGLHQVKSAGGTTGVLTLKTRCNLKPSYITVTGTFEADDETFIGDSSAHIVDIETFKDVINSRRPTPYIFIDNAAHGSNHGLFSLTANSTSGKITLNKKISIDTDGDYTETAASAVDGGSDVVTIFNAFYEQISVYEGVEVLSGESAETFELDISRYQANAVVYYLKAKLAEDAGDMENREFFLREFKRQLEKGNSALKRGPYIVQGFKEMI
jgi:hypothetical protein